MEDKAGKVLEVVITFYDDSGDKIKQVSIDSEVNLDTHYSTLTKHELSIVHSFATHMNDFNNFIRGLRKQEQDKTPKEKVM
jgi:hypothetical protein